MMNAVMAPTESSQQIPLGHISCPGSTNNKYNFTQVAMIHSDALAINYASGFQMLLTLSWQ